MFDARKDAKTAGFSDAPGCRYPFCPACGKSVMSLSGHAEYMVRLKSYLDPSHGGHLALLVMES